MILKMFCRMMDSSLVLLNVPRTQKSMKYPLAILQGAGLNRKVSHKPVHVEKDEHTEFNKTITIQKLKELFDYHTSEASEIFLRYKNFTKTSPNSITENYFICKHQGISKETMLKHPGILAEADIGHKIRTLKSLKLDINITVPLLMLSPTILSNFVFKEVIEGRIEIIARLFQVGESEVCELMMKKPFILSLDINHLTTNFLLLSEFGITVEDVIKDLWVLRYSPSVIRERLNLAKSYNIETMKTWMVRAQLDIFNTYVKRKSDKKLILGDNSVVEYLSERLECSVDLAKFIISKQPALQNKSLKKMNELIDFLLNYGFKPVQICRTPKILLHSVGTIEKRLKEMEGLGMQTDALYILTKSQKQYMQVLESLKTHKSKN